MRATLKLILSLLLELTGVKRLPESATPGSAGHVRKFAKSGLLSNGCGSLILRSMTVVRKVLVAITALLLALL